MLEDDVIFLYELVGGLQRELGFVSPMIDHPDIKEHRLNYSDWLDEQGRPQSSILVRKGFTPSLFRKYGKHDAVAHGDLAANIEVPYNTENAKTWAELRWGQSDLSTPLNIHRFVPVPHIGMSDNAGVDKWWDL